MNTSFTSPPENRYAIFDNMMEGVQVINYAWRYVYVNEALVRHGKIPRNELLGHTMMEKYPGLENTEVFHFIDKTMKEREACQLINEFEFPDGSKNWFDLRIEPVIEGVLILSFDISEQKRLEEELRQLNEQLESRVDANTLALLESLERERNLLQIKSRFISMASHEFRTPLTSILSSISLLGQYTGSELMQHRDKHVERIKTAVRNLTSILEDFLSIDKLDQENHKVKNELFNLPEFIRELHSEVEGLTKTDQCILWSLHTESLIQLDKQMLRNIILNLLSNAIKYSDSDISVDMGFQKENFVISISDKGIGIPEEEQENLFNGFFRASNAHPIHGTGLGLSIVKRYVDLMQGAISFSSRQNEGTTFIVTFPHCTPPT